MSDIESHIQKHRSAQPIIYIEIRHYHRFHDSKTVTKRDRHYVQLTQY